MKTAWTLLAGLFLGMSLILAWPTHRIEAQTATLPALVMCSGVHTTCPIPANAPSAEIASDGFWYTPNGLNQVNLAATAGAPALTLNGTTKALPGPFTISAGTTPITAQ